MADAIVMEKGAAAAVRGRDSVDEHRDDLIEFFAPKLAVRCGPANECKEFIFIPIIDAARGDELLC